MIRKIEKWDWKTSEVWNWKIIEMHIPSGKNEIIQAIDWDNSDPNTKDSFIKPKHIETSSISENSKFYYDQFKLYKEDNPELAEFYYFQYAIALIKEEWDLDEKTRFDYTDQKLNNLKIIVSKILWEELKKTMRL